LRELDLRQPVSETAMAFLGAVIALDSLSGFTTRADRCAREVPFFAWRFLSNEKGSGNVYQAKRGGNGHIVGNASGTYWLEFRRYP
jgi:hypothetical protein